MSTKAIPEGYHTITPMLVLKDSRKAIAFYKKAFGGTERCVTPGPEGKGIMHAEMTIGNSKIMMSDECPNRHTKSAETMGTSPVSFYLYVNDLDTAFQRAVHAGASANGVAGNVLGRPRGDGTRPVRLLLDVGHPRGRRFAGRDEVAALKPCMREQGRRNEFPLREARPASVILSAASF